MIDSVSGANNPGYQHGCKLSPFSKNFVSYAGMTDEEKFIKTVNILLGNLILLEEHFNRIQ
jgi:hypothetical protein